MDIQDWGAFIRGRWDWSKGGYEKGFPRGCQFTDVDAGIEFDGLALVIEAKHWDGIGERPEIGQGQARYLRDEVRRGKTALGVFGCGPCNDPWAVRHYGATEKDDRWYDWRDVRDKGVRRRMFKHLINQAMGLLEQNGECPGVGLYPKRRTRGAPSTQGDCPTCNQSVELLLAPDGGAGGVIGPHAPPEDGA